MAWRTGGGPPAFFLWGRGGGGGATASSSRRTSGGTTRRRSCRGSPTGLPDAGLGGVARPIPSVRWLSVHGQRRDRPRDDRGVLAGRGTGRSDPSLSRGANSGVRGGCSFSRRNPTRVYISGTSEGDVTIRCDRIFMGRAIWTVVPP